jgi:DNA-binding GntR family transcriptional regulator
MRQLLENFDPHEFTQLNQRFHTILFERCPNPHLLDLVHRGWRRLPGVRDSTFTFIPDRAGHSVDEHDALLELIADGGEQLQIELAARDHRLRTLDQFLAARHPDLQAPTEDQ